MKIRYRQTFLSVSLVITDVFMVLAALRFSFWLKFDSGILPVFFGRPDFSAYARTFGLIVFVTILFLRHSGLYMEEKIQRLGDEALLVLKSTALTFLLLFAVTFFYRTFTYSRTYLVTAWVMVPLFIMLGRIPLFYLYMYYRRTSGKFKEILIIGASREAAKLAIRYKREVRYCTRVVGILDDDYPKLKTYKKLRVFDHPDNLGSFLDKNENINEVIVASKKIDRDRIIGWRLLCDKHLVSFKWTPDMLGILATNFHLSHELGMTLISSKDSPLLNWENRLIKRVADFVLTAAGLVVISPLLLLVAIIVKLDSPGPILYKQKRVGEDGRNFNIYKFRTMKVGAEDATGPVWASKDDDRRTRTGAFLRKTNIDELPQLWNVLRGDMSLVGPRPERPHFVGQFREDIPRYMARHRIKAGLTGWAQVHGLRGDTSIEKRTEYDLYYIENWSILLDLRILIKTLFAFKNAY